MNMQRPARDLDPGANPASAARTIILRQLTNSPKSRYQLAQKLTERDIPDDVAQAVLDRFEEVNLIDDAEFARLWVQSRARTKSLAREALNRELTEKGISAEIAQEALAQLSVDGEQVSAKALVQRKIRASMDLSDRAERDKYTRRWVAMLARKGYNPAMAFQIVGEVIAESHEDESLLD